MAELTIDCEDPLYENNANCLTYIYGDGETFKSTDFGSSITIIIVGGIIIVLLLMWVMHTLV